MKSVYCPVRLLYVSAFQREDSTHTHEHTHPCSTKHFNFLCICLYNFYIYTSWISRLKHNICLFFKWGRRPTCPTEWLTAFFWVLCPLWLFFFYIPCSFPSVCSGFKIHLGCFKLADNWAVHNKTKSTRAEKRANANNQKHGLIQVDFAVYEMRMFLSPSAFSASAAQLFYPMQLNC